MNAVQQAFWLKLEIILCSGDHPSQLILHFCGSCSTFSDNYFFQIDIAESHFMQGSGIGKLPQMFVPCSFFWYFMSATTMRRPDYVNVPFSIPCDTVLPFSVHATIRGRKRERFSTQFTYMVKPKTYLT